MIQTRVVKLYPNSTMRQVLDQLCNYRRYCWNEGLAVWNAMYDESLLLQNKKLRPNKYKVRNELVANKQDWQYAFSSRVLQLAVSDVSEAWQRFLDKAQTDWGRPHFKTKKDQRQGFKTDRGKIVQGKLRLDKPHGYRGGWYDIPFRGAEKISGELTVVSVFRENGTYYAALPFKTKITPKKKTGKATGVDLNVGHINYAEGIENICPKRLQKLYARIKHYQRLLAKKRQVNGRAAGTKSKKYAQTRAKLQRDYRKVAAIQYDLMHKLTTKLVTVYDRIVIEDLDVKTMKMTHVASKGLHRSLFGLFRKLLTYKCEWYGKELIVADRFYPSTQRCSQCGHVKTGEDKITLRGNQKHHTRHNEYICYVCGAVLDRDENAVQNLLALAQ